MSEHETSPPLPDQIYEELKAFSFERDSEFRERKSHVAPFPRMSNFLVDTVHDEDGETSYDLFNTKKLELIAKYNITGTERPSSRTPLLFTLQLNTTTQLRALPPALHQNFDTDDVQHYDAVGLGHLEETQSLEYAVHDIAILGRIGIVKTLEYILTDNDNPIYSVRDPAERRLFERVPVASEQRTLIVPPSVTHEQATDQFDQLIYDSTFQAMHQTPDRLNEGFKQRDHDAALTIRGLMKVLRSSAPIPTIDELDAVIKKMNQKK